MRRRWFSDEKSERGGAGDQDKVDVTVGGLLGMTVLEEARMSGSLGGDRYITPEYLAPLPQVIMVMIIMIMIMMMKMIMMNTLLHFHR